jgi:hypothetical protein
LFKWVQDYEDAFTELVILGQATWNDDDIKKRRLVQNAQNIGMVDIVFEALVDDKSSLETCNLLRSHAIRYDHKIKRKMQDKSIMYLNLLVLLRRIKSIKF